MKKSDLCQIADLIDERLDVKFDEKLKNFATKDDLKNFATKDDLCRVEEDLHNINERLDSFATKDDLHKIDKKLNDFATKDDLYKVKEDLELAIENVAINTSKSFEEFETRINERFDNIDEELLKRPTRDEIFDKWDDKILQISCDVDALKYLHRDEWQNLPNRESIKNSI
ncbi:MAG TPA: hypothetical protein PLD95_01610 [bacterium]|jgi:hypothetical protein|nr:hypothetical protein [bacterium]HOG38145.1 hypothetical protein [bacterium]